MTRSMTNDEIADEQWPSLTEPGQGIGKGRVKCRRLTNWLVRYWTRQKGQRRWLQLDLRRRESSGLRAPKQSPHTALVFLCRLEMKLGHMGRENRAARMTLTSSAADPRAKKKSLNKLSINPPTRTLGINLLETAGHNFAAQSG